MLLRKRPFLHYEVLRQFWAQLQCLEPTGKVTHTHVLNPHQEFTAFHIRLNDLGSYINCSLCANRNEKLCSIVLQSNTSDFHQTCSDCDAAPQKKKGHWIHLLSSNPNLIYWSNIIKIEWASYQLKKKPQILFYFYLKSLFI